jgi:hypothetical protein
VEIVWKTTRANRFFLTADFIFPGCTCMIKIRRRKPEKAFLQINNEIELVALRINSSG